MLKESRQRRRIACLLSRSGSAHGRRGSPLSGPQTSARVALILLWARANARSASAPCARNSDSTHARARSARCQSVQWRIAITRPSHVAVTFQPPFGSGEMSTLPVWVCGSTGTGSVECETTAASVTHCRTLPRGARSGDLSSPLRDSPRSHPPRLTRGLTICRIRLGSTLCASRTGPLRQSLYGGRIGNGTVPCCNTGGAARISPRWDGSCLRQMSRSSAVASPG